MRTEAEIRAAHDTLEGMLNLPGDIPPDADFLPRSHLTLLKWVLGYETPTTKAMEAVYKAIRKELNAHAPKNAKVNYTTQPSNN